MQWISCIQGLTLPKANYDAAITMLQERFSRGDNTISADSNSMSYLQKYSLVIVYFYYSYWLSQFGIEDSELEDPKPEEFDLIG